MTEQEKTENCYRQMYDGMVRKDSRLLSEVLDDNFVLIHMTGMRQSKEVFIQAVEDGTLNYYSATHQEIKTEIHGESFASNDIRHTIPRFNDPDNLAKNQALAEAVKAFADEKMLSPAQVSLAWLLHRKPWIVPIPGTKNLCRLQENMSAAYIDFSDEDMARLTEISDSSTVYGGRYSPEMEKMTGR